MSCFTHDENRVRARELLITRIKERIPETPQVVVDLLINPMAEGESWEQMAKRRKTEKQAKVTICILVNFCTIHNCNNVCFCMLSCCIMQCTMVQFINSILVLPLF